MTDHLTRLAARALGLAETIRPRRTLFEPQAVVLEQVSSSEPDRGQPPPAPAAEAPQARTVVVNPQAREEPSRSEAAEQVPPEEPGLVETVALETPRAEPVPAPSEVAPSLPARTDRPERPLAREELAVSPRPPADRRIERVTKVVAQRVPLLSARHAYASPPPQREPELAPTVRVTIGRLDVSAVAPEQPVERPRKRPPRMSLEEYLSRDPSGPR